MLLKGIGRGRRHAPSPIAGGGNGAGAAGLCRRSADPGRTGRRALTAASIAPAPAQAAAPASRPAARACRSHHALGRCRRACARARARSGPRVRPRAARRPAAAAQAFSTSSNCSTSIARRCCASHLYADVHLVHFEPGRIELRPEPRPRRATCPTGSASSSAEWTGQRWVVSVSDEPGRADACARTDGIARAR